MRKKFIVTNFAYGTGPYLRTTALAAAFNDELEKRGLERMKIIVPLVYGEKQKKIMAEEFGNLLTSDIDRQPTDVGRPKLGEIIFDEKLGEILGDVFYPVRSRASNGVYGDYSAALENWILTCKEVSQAAREHLKNTYGDSIAIELARSPRVRYDIAPAYFTSFAYIAEILEQARGKKEISVDQKLLEKGVKIADWVESAYKIHAIAYPATFSWEENYKPRYPTEILTPPIAPPPFGHSGKIDRGIFVTITGIPGLERLYREAVSMGLKLYSNDTKAVAASTWALPHIIPNQNTLFQFARSGWSSVWISMISGTPLVVPDFDSKDDPEIYFNNLAIAKLGIGVIYRGQPLGEILSQRERFQASCSKLRDSIMNRWGTLDGNKYCAKLFADDLV